MLRFESNLGFICDEHSDEPLFTSFGLQHVQDCLKQRSIQRWVSSFFSLERLAQFFFPKIKGFSKKVKQYIAINNGSAQAVTSFYQQHEGVLNTSPLTTQIQPCTTAFKLMNVCTWQLTKETQMGLCFAQKYFSTNHQQTPYQHFCG